MSKINEIITILDRNGMPVRYLRSVSKASSIEWNEDSSSRITQSRWQDYKDTSTVHFSSSDTIGMPRKGELYALPSPKSIDSLYHEFTHAYIVNNDMDERTYKFWRDAVKHYSLASLKKYGGRVTTGGLWDQTEQATLEAIAMYVGSRAGATWTVINKMNMLEKFDLHFNGFKTKNIRSEQITFYEELIKKVPLEFNKVCANNVHGYVDKEISMGWTSKTIQNKIAKPISKELKSFCDREFLENKIHSEFYKNKWLADPFMSLLWRVQKLLGDAKIKNHSNYQKPNPLRMVNKLTPRNVNGRIPGPLNTE
jgi:hypothetical protein